jgi:hypothetical protein
MHVLAAKDDSVSLVKLLKPFVKEETLRGRDCDGRMAWEVTRSEEVRYLLKPKDETREKAVITDQSPRNPGPKLTKYNNHAR